MEVEQYVIVKVLKKDMGEKWNLLRLFSWNKNDFFSKGNVEKVERGRCLLFLGKVQIILNDFKFELFFFLSSEFGFVLGFIKIKMWFGFLYIFSICFGLVFVGIFQS